MENLEFTVIPKALLTPDEEALMCSDKSKAMHLIEELQCQRNGDEEEYIQSDVLLIDEMAAVNQIHKSSTMVACNISIC